MRSVAALVAVILTVAGCSDPEKPPDSGLSGTCGLPKIRDNLEIDRIPDEFVIPGAEIARTQDVQGRFIATINVGSTVTQAYRAYREQLKDTDWKTVTEENEGFEAEIYLATDKQLAALQMRSSTCEGKIVVYASIINRGRNGN